MIVMRVTTDFLVNQQRVIELKELMGDNLPWVSKETETGVKYFKL